MKDIGYRGTDSKELKTISAAECHDKCLNDERCDFFTWQEAGKYCWFKVGASTASTKYDRIGDYSAPKTCGLPTTCVKERTKYSGETVGTFPKSETRWPNDQAVSLLSTANKRQEQN
ncbi:UNVERIFIED_CONTAM: microneme protein MIC17C [Hammondia hammondi]|eukprot:XP_008888949.1 microneme protein MIC17C [Hammondia hammondi]